MKQLNAGGDKEQWETRLLKDLAFIKEKGRYPISKKVLRPVALLIFLGLFIARFAWPVIVASHSNNITLPVILVGINIVFVAIVFSQYYATIRFIKIITKHHLSKNQQVLLDFFKSQHLAHSQHPDAPEVFMILSKNLSMKGDMREVMIFITDDKQILVNSHFTGNRFSISPPSKHYKQMANRLREWINIHIDNDNTAALSINKN